MYIYSTITPEYMNLLQSAMVITISVIPFVGPSSEGNGNVNKEINNTMINSTASNLSAKVFKTNYSAPLEFVNFNEQSHTMVVDKAEDEDLLVGNDELVMASVSNRFFEKLSTWHGTRDQVSENIDKFLKKASEGTYNISVVSVSGYRKNLQVTLER
ncbi:MAG: hypothetical protein NXI20_19690 [bacterium]|nr:hypothetical protein [bacterium]